MNTKNAHTLVFLGNENLAPMVYMENGNPRGVVVDIVSALKAKMGRTIEFKAMNWATAQKMVAQGKADALVQLLNCMAAQYLLKANTGRVASSLLPFLQEKY